MRNLSLIILCFCFQINFAQELTNNPLLSENPIEQKKWVDSVYNAMSVKERIGQLYLWFR